MARDSTAATWTNLVEHVAWKVRGAKDVRMATLDVLSELDRSPKWRDVANRVPDGGPGLNRFLNAVSRRVEELL
jgi:hypothetical protein